MTRTSSPEVPPAGPADFTEATDAPEVAPSSAWSGLAGFRRIGCGLLGLQLIALMIYSVVEFQRYGLSGDYSFYAQAWFQFAHAHMATSFLRNQGEVTFVLLAPLYWLWPQGPILLWVQDIAIVAAELVAFIWMCEVAADLSGPRHAAGRQVHEGPRYLSQALVGAGLVALLADPWIWWTSAWDFHFETVAVLFAILFARELQKGRRRAWVWAALTLLSGTVAASYLVAIGFGALVASRRRLCGAIAVVAGVAWIAALHGFGFMKATGDAVLTQALAGQTSSGQRSPSGLLGLSFGLLLHPAHLLSVIWSKRVDILANLASAGLLGVLAPTVVFVILVVVVENSLYPGLLFSQPSFQSIPIYIFGPVGAVMFLAWLARRHRWVSMGLAVAVMIEMIGWGVVWLPRTPSQWIRVPASAAAKLDQFSKVLPPGAEVVVSQGIAGRFAVGHRQTRIAGVGGSIPLDGRPVWFLLAPDVGIETAPPASEDALVGELATSRRARPVVVGSGIWSYVYTPPAKQTRFRVPGVPTVLPAWEFHSTSGKVITSGPTSAWRVVGMGKKGYLVWGDYWNEPTGSATATTELSGRGTVYLEVWDVTTDTLLAERRVSLVGGRVEASIPFEVPTPRPATIVFHGFGPFGLAPLIGSTEDQLEVRIYDFGSGSKPIALSVGMSRSP